MAFYKKDGEELLVAPNFVRARTFTLLARNHATYTYPVDGWYWFDTIEEANAAFGIKAPEVNARQVRLRLAAIGWNQEQTEQFVSDSSKL